jgi:hypothetical protein
MANDVGWQSKNINSNELPIEPNFPSAIFMTQLQSEQQ